jgi:thioredoxin-like negative regulator of GroEL
MLTFERVGPREWTFPESDGEVSDRFYTGCELWEEGKTAAALAIFQDLLQRHPEHLDVRNRLARYYEEIGQQDRAQALLEEAVTLGRRAFPRAFRAIGSSGGGWSIAHSYAACAAWG